MTRPARFTEADIARAYRAAVKAGMPNPHISISPMGELQVFPGVRNVANDNGGEQAWDAAVQT